MIKNLKLEDVGNTVIKAVNNPKKEVDYKGLFELALNGKVWDILKDLVYLTDAVVCGEFNLSNQTKAVLAIDLVYLVLPMDLIADVIPMVGFIDDIALITWSLKLMDAELKAFKQTSAYTTRLEEGATIVNKLVNGGIKHLVDNVKLELPNFLIDHKDEEINVMETSLVSYSATRTYNKVRQEDTINFFKYDEQEIIFILNNILKEGMGNCIIDVNTIYNKLIVKDKNIKLEIKRIVDNIENYIDKDYFFITNKETLVNPRVSISIDKTNSNKIELTYDVVKLHEDSFDDFNYSINNYGECNTFKVNYRYNKQFDRYVIYNIVDIINKYKNSEDDYSLSFEIKDFNGKINCSYDSISKQFRISTMSNYCMYFINEMLMLN